MSSRTFDIVVVGAGPSAVAALHGIGDCGSVAIVSGETTRSPSVSDLHPKIRAVSVESGERPAAAIAYARAHDAKPLLSSAGAGGLANYWGQQFVRYAPGDPWPTTVFADYAAYIDACEAVEGLFALVGGEEVRPASPLEGGYSLRTPRLLVGAAGVPGTGLLAMRLAFQAAAERTWSQVFRTRAVAVRSDRQGCEVRLEDGSILRAGRVLLASGVIGTARIVQESFPDIRRLRFSDHAPWMLYTVGLGEAYGLRPRSAPRHFNALTLEKEAEGQVLSFSSLYDMGRAELNLLLASTLGHTFQGFRGLGAPWGASLLKPVQIWTPDTFDEVEIDTASGLASSTASGPVDPASDAMLADAAAALRRLGGRRLKVSRTAPGFGFHYHALKAENPDGRFHPISEVLMDRCGERVVCADASVLAHIGVRPHTLTAMATVQRIANRAVQAAG